MSRTSRIPHPAGSRYVAIYAWAVGRFGLAGAAIIGLLEFFDRAQSVPGQPLASRARILADLEGIAGRDAIDSALKALQDASVIEKNTITEPGLKNLERRVQYSLNPSGLARLFGTPEIRSSRNSGFQEPPEPLKSGLKSGVPSYIDLEEEAAAPRACARKHANENTAAAPFREGKRRRQRASGIVTWTPDDLPEAERIEHQHNADLISAAVAALVAVGKQPVPGLVAILIERTQRDQAATARKETADAEYLAHSRDHLNPDAQAKGALLLPAFIREKIQSKTPPQTEATT